MLALIVLTFNRKMDRPCTGVLNRLSNVLHGFEGAVNELRGIERTLRLGASDNNQDQAEPNLQLIAQTLKETVGALMDAVPEIQTKLDSRQPSGVASPKLDVCQNSSRAVKRKTMDERLCRHSCRHHAEVVDVSLWNKLPTDLVELVFAHLPLPKILELRQQSKAWLRMSTTSNFNQACDSLLFGMLGFRRRSKKPNFAFFDYRSYQWLHLELHKPTAMNKIGDIMGAEAIYGHSGGLFCCLERTTTKGVETPPSVHICNPLIGDWKIIPRSDLTRCNNAIVMQLVTYQGRGGYDVDLVTHDCENGVYVSEYYDSQSGLWSTRDSGLVCGRGVVSPGGYHTTLVFDCASKNFAPSFPFRPGGTVCWNFFQGRYVVAEWVKSEPYALEVSEHKWRSSTQEWEKVWTQKIQWNRKVVRSTPRLFATEDFIVLVEDDLEGCHQWTALYEKENGRRYRLPKFFTMDYVKEKVVNRFMCRLSWDAIP